MYKSKHTFEKRLDENTKIRTKHPGYCPIICERDSNCSTVPSIDKTKYLVPRDLTMGQFAYVIRQRLKLKSEIAIFLFIGNVILPTSALIKRIYEDYKEQDGFLYIKYSGENTFGF